MNSPNSTPKGVRRDGAPRIHCAATDDPYDSETDKIAIDHFLDILAEVAMSVASRNAQPDGTQGE